MSKKGISPLIATVLIIGFTIVLAALVMQWGGGLFKSVQDQTGKTSDFKIICSSKLSGLEVTAKAGGGVKIDNKNQQKIEGFLFRKYDAAGAVVATCNTGVAGQTVPNGDTLAGTVLNAFDVKTYTLSCTPALATTNKVGVFPKVLVGTEVMTCENEWKVGVTA